MLAPVRADHDVVGAQHAQLLRDDRLREAERFLQLLDAPVLPHEHLENPDPDGWASALKNAALNVCRSPTSRRLARRVIYNSIY